MSTRTHERIKNAENFYKLVADIHGKCKITKAGKKMFIQTLLHAYINIWSRNMDIDKDRYECKLRASEMRFLINVKKQP
jgi:hypothetical protein